MKDWPAFDQAMKNSKHYNNCREKLDEWAIIEQRYEAIRNRSLQKSKIPKIIHQIWLGEEIPNKQKELCNNIKNSLSSDWEYKFWTLNEISQIKNFKNIELFNKTPNYGQKSDIFRNEILNEIGGIYLDTDVVLIKPFDELLDLDFFCSIVYDPFPSLTNSIIGCTPKSTVINDMLFFTEDIKWHNSMAIINSTGPYHTTRKFFKNIVTENNIIALPVSFLCPQPNYEASNPYHQFIQKETICCHLWHCSWM
jgi:mannosyltransferase OCH1-like enzyme